MSLLIQPIQIGFAGTVTGIDLLSPISRDEAAAIEAGMDRHGVLVLFLGLRFVMASKPKV